MGVYAKALRPGEQVVDYEKDVRGGSIGFSGVNDAFDLILVKTATNQYLLVCFMRIQFFFNNGNGGKWTHLEKNRFVTEWKAAIKARWNGRTIKTLSNGKTIKIDFRFETQIDGIMLDHWEITVTKVNRFTRSSVNPVSGNVKLDSLDLQLTLKSAGVRQRGAVHEFGHMLGLPDEYKSGNPHSNDYRAIMNSGELKRTRYYSQFTKWLNIILKNNNIH